MSTLLRSMSLKEEHVDFSPHVFSSRPQTMPHLHPQVLQEKTRISTQHVEMARLWKWTRARQENVKSTIVHTPQNYPRCHLYLRCVPSLSQRSVRHQTCEVERATLRSSCILSEVPPRLCTAFLLRSFSPNLNPLKWRTSRT